MPNYRFVITSYRCLRKLLLDEDILVGCEIRDLVDYETLKIV